MSVCVYIFTEAAFTTKKPNSSLTRCSVHSRRPAEYFYAVFLIIIALLQHGCFVFVFVFFYDTEMLSNLTEVCSDI